MAIHRDVEKRLNIEIHSASERNKLLASEVKFIAIRSFLSESNVGASSAKTVCRRVLTAPEILKANCLE